MKITDKITITNEDNMEMMARYPDKYFDLAIVDPPYGIGVNVSMGRRKGDKKSDYHKFEGGDENIPHTEYFNELFRISKHQIIWGGNYMTDNLYPSPCWLMWDKGFSEDVTFAQFELAWTSFKTSCKKFDKHPSQQNRRHPTQKPVELYKWILDRYANHNALGLVNIESDIRIVDTHHGSGTLSEACHDYDFELVACELDTKYYKSAVKHVKNHVSQLKMF